MDGAAGWGAGRRLLDGELEERALLGDLLRDLLVHAYLLGEGGGPKPSAHHPHIVLRTLIKLIDLPTRIENIPSDGMTASGT